MIQGAQTDFIYVFYLQDIDYDRSQRNIKKVKGIPQYKKYTSNVRLLFYLIAGIIDELTGENKQEHHNKFFEILQSSLTTIGSFKFLILCHKLIYQLQQEFTSRFISNKLIPGDHTDKSRLAIYYYNFLSKLCENFDYYKEVIDFIETENIVKFLQYELLVQIQILFPLASLLQELSQVTFPIYQVVKLLDYLLCRESPLLLQLGTCILKDFCVIYNFLSAAIQELQSRSFYKSLSINFESSFKRSQSALSRISNHHPNDKMHEETPITQTLLQFQITTLLHYHH